jgi:hypothetical protein
MMFSLPSNGMFRAVERSSGTQPTPTDKWTVGRPQWRGRLHRPFAHLLGKADWEESPFHLAWILFLLPAAGLELVVHALFITPPRWLTQPSVRNAGWTVEVIHTTATDVRLDPRYKTRTITTLRVPKRAAARWLAKALKAHLRPGITLGHSGIRQLLATTQATPVDQRTTYST